jgi:hypothetical protein
VSSKPSWVYKENPCLLSQKRQTNKQTKKKVKRREQKKEIKKERKRVVMQF